VLVGGGTLVYFEKATLQALARHSSTRVAAWHLRRLLAAGCWPWVGSLQSASQVSLLESICHLRNLLRSITHDPFLVVAGVKALDEFVL